MAETVNKELDGLLEDALDDLLLDDNDNSTKVTNSKSVEDSGNAHDFKTGAGSSDTVDEAQMEKFFENMNEQLKTDMNPKEMKARIDETVPQLFDLMQNLLSKELLYPALRDMSPKFDEWLKKNDTTLSKQDRKRFKKQRDIVNEIIANFDNESMEDHERFEKNLDLMEKMQSFGSPPEELTVPGTPKCPVM